MNYIPHGRSLLEVHLNRIVTTPERYFVELKKDDVSVASFDMKNDGFDRWKPIEPAPDWVEELVAELNAVIQTHRRAS
jgi:hypothetical protein